MVLRFGNSARVWATGIGLGSLFLAGAVYGAITAAQLQQAHTDFLQGHYRNVVRTLWPFDRHQPRRLSQDFMLAVSRCHTGAASDGSSRLNALLRDYVMPKGKIEDIQAQIVNCGKSGLPVAGIAGKGDESRVVGIQKARVSASLPASESRPEMSGLEYGWSYNQGDLYSRRSNSAIECANLCLGDARCRAITWIQSQRLCWIKDRIPVNRRMSSDMVSAIKLFD